MQICPLYRFCPYLHGFAVQSVMYAVLGGFAQNDLSQVAYLAICYIVIHLLFIIDIHIYNHGLIAPNL